MRKQLIAEIIKKHKVMKKPTDEEKLKRRKRYEDKQRELRRKRRIRKVVSTKVKRKKVPQVSACPECRDFHLKKSDQCKVRGFDTYEPKTIYTYRFKWSIFTP